MGFWDTLWGSTEEPELTDSLGLIEALARKNDAASQIDFSSAPSFEATPRVSPYDALLEDQQKSYSSIDTELGKLRESRSGLSMQAENDWGAIGSALLPALGAGLAGGSMGDILGAGAKAGEGYLTAA
jgi:hypothetical protein